MKNDVEIGIGNRNTFGLQQHQLQVQHQLQLQLQQQLLQQLVVVVFLVELLF